jgi:predicted nucleotidyltransferase
MRRRIYGYNASIVLFSSYTHGAPHAWSDIHVAVLSPNFRGLNVWRRQRLITKARAAKRYDVMVEALGYTCDEFRRAHHPTFLGEIKRTGKVV